MFNAVPMRRNFRVPTCWAMRIIVQRRLGLPLDDRRGPSLWRAHVHGARRSRSGSYGRFGEQYRARRPQPTPPADRVLRQLVLITCRACGARWSRWSRRITSATRTTTGPTSLAGGSARRARARLIGDVKFKDPLSSTTWRTSGGAVPTSASGQHRARHAGGRLWPRTARRQGVRGGQGRAEKPRRGWVDGRKRAGPALHVCRATARARGWVGRAPSDSILVSLPVDSARMK